jgi:hypothetical protein
VGVSPEKATFFPLLAGAAAGILERDSKYINVAMYKRDMVRYRKEQVMAFVKRYGTPVAAVLLAVLLGVIGVCGARVRAQYHAVSGLESRLKSVMPRHAALTKDDALISGYLAALEPAALRHQDVVAAVNAIDARLGTIEVVSWAFRADGTSPAIEMQVKSRSYDEVSEFLKDLREEKLFRSIMPVSSEPVQDENKESIRFKIAIEL